MTPCNIAWLRRDLRLQDNGALAAVFEKPEPVQPVFIFDTDILARFRNPADRRLSFIADSLGALHQELKQRGGGLLALHGPAKDVMPQLAETLSSNVIAAGEDYEPDGRSRDENVARASAPRALVLVKDNVILSPLEVLRPDHAPYKVYTPYSRAWRDRQVSKKEVQFRYQDNGRYAEFRESAAKARSAGLRVLDMEAGPERVLREIGYRHVSCGEWNAQGAQQKLQRFLEEKAQRYATTRDFLAEDGTSRISPYLRFGIVSVRECYQGAKNVPGAEKWIGELIWREFYAMILYHYPESASVEWNPAYRNRIEWSRNEKHLEAWMSGRTGYPVVDAAMRQLLEIGWMHNRARMIVASFLTKHLLIDWRQGEEHFAQFLMDYDLASNVGGWQWAASTGTDAQPYFRVFNPYLQSKNFDPSGDYIRRYVPELRHLQGDDIHCPPALHAPDYPRPIVEHKSARERAIAAFSK